MELTENKDLLQTVFDSAFNGIAVMQSAYSKKGKVEDFSILLFNAFTLNWIGDIDYKGKRYSDVFPMVKETGILDRFIEVAETGVPANFECWYDGEGMNNWFRFTAVKHAELIVITTEDITERKQTEIILNKALEATQKQKHLYDSITNNIPDLVYVFDLNYRFIYANEALLTMWGKSAKDAIGKGLRENGYEEWHALMHEREIDAVVATKKSIRGTVSFPHAELGTRIYDYILSPVYNKAGEVEVVAGSTRDISELKQTEDNLQRSESRFRNMIEQAPVAILLSKGEDVVIETVNKPMLRFMNKTVAADVVGKKMLEVLPELTGQEALQTVINVQKTGIPFRGDEQPVDLMINGRMERRYFNFSYDFIRESEESSAVLHMAVDVTEQVLTRRKIEESETRLKSVIDQTPAPTLVLNGDDLVIEQVNEPMLQMIGRGDDIIGKPLIDILPELEGQYVWQQVQKVYTAGTSFDMSEVLVSHNRGGAIGDFYYNISYRPRRENGQITGMIQVAIDVTEQVTARKKLEESENRFRLLSDEMPQFVWTGDAAGNLGYFNEAVYKYSGLSPEQVAKEGWIQIVHPDDRDENIRLWLHSIATGDDFFFEHRFRRADGEYRWQLSRAVAQKDEHGITRHWVGTSTDIQDQKTFTEKLESLVAERTKELQRSNEDLQQFAHVASHDLKEPVRKIKTFTDRLEHNLAGKLDADGSRFIEKIHIATDRMFTMIDGVLNYSTANAEMQHSESVDLNEVIKNIETDLEITLHATAAKIRSSKLPVLEGASVLLYQLFYNLINNSIKFVEPDTAPGISISSELISVKEEKFARIILQDNGIGFETEYAERIFETFTRLNSKDRYEGTGLGLALCRKIAERHGGSITASGIPGKGSSFVITLPVKQTQGDI